MKTKVTLLIILIVILITLSIVLMYPFPNGGEKRETAVNSEPLENYKTLTYIITEVDGNQYFGESVDGKSKIQFHRDRVKYPITDSIKVHDKILAYVESENHIDGIVRVEKIEEEKD